MSDLISKKEFNDKLVQIMLKCRNWSAEEAIGEALEQLNIQPTVDAAPVVRCKDCKHRHTFDCMCRDRTYDDWFCADGEREERE